MIKKKEKFYCSNKFVDDFFLKKKKFANKINKKYKIKKKKK